MQEIRSDLLAQCRIPVMSQLYGDLGPSFIAKLQILYSHPDKGRAEPELGSAVHGCIISLSCRSQENNSLLDIKVHKDLKEQHDWLVSLRFLP